MDDLHKLASVNLLLLLTCSYISRTLMLIFCLSVVSYRRGNGYY